MKATYNKDAKTKFTTSHRKEGKCYFHSYTAIVEGTDYNGKPTQNTPVELRLYGTGAKNFACIWVNDNASGTHTSGTGSAGGYGYHRPSAAAQAAINNAGFELSENISGVGDGAIERAVKAIAESLGYLNVFVFHAHQ